MSAVLTAFMTPARLTSVVDIGANPIDALPPYISMLNFGRCTVIGFEPQPDALAKLKAAKGPLETYYPYAVGDGERHTLHVCQAPGMTSLLEPDPETLQLFNHFPQYAEVFSTEEIQTRRLDDIHEIAAVDFLKMDVQGSELSILVAGRDKLKDAIAVQLEVSFTPLYKNQPPFWMLDKELREQGFVLHRFMDVKKRGIAPLMINNDAHLGLHHVMEADLVYVRNFYQPTSLTVEQWFHMALTAHYCFKSPDLVVRALRSLAILEAVSEHAIEAYVLELGEWNKSVEFSV